jgi:hypothetical protein
MVYYMSLEEQMRTKKLKEEKRFPWSDSAWEAAARRIHEPPPPPRIHLIILQAPLDTPAVIKQLAGLSEMPAVEQTKTIPEEGEEEETVSVCRLSDNPYCEISEWIVEGGDYFLKPVYVVFEGKRKAARKAIPMEDEVVGD